LAFFPHDCQPQFSSWMGKFTSTIWHGSTESDCGSAWPGSIGAAAPTGAIMKFEKLGNFKPCHKLAGAR
jgi:hypothetical protein